MSQELRFNDNDIMRLGSEAWFNDNGTMREAAEIWFNDNGTMRQIYSGTGFKLIWPSFSRHESLDLINNGQDDKDYDTPNYQTPYNYGTYYNTLDLRTRFEGGTSRFTMVANNASVRIDSDTFNANDVSYVGAGLIFGMYLIPVAQLATATDGITVVDFIPTVRSVSFQSNEGILLASHQVQLCINTTKSHLYVAWPMPDKFDVTEWVTGDIEVELRGTLKLAPTANLTQVVDIPFYYGITLVNTEGHASKEGS